MNKIILECIPQELKLMQSEICNSNMIQLYSNFDFKYLSVRQYLQISNFENEIKSFLIKYLSNYQFITYQYVNLMDEQQNQNLRTMICIEKKCLIIDNISKEMMNDILKKTKSSLINTNPTCLKSSQEYNDKQISEEIDSFTFFFKKYINNQFIKETFRPISAYLIRRFCYPTSFFKDPKFFNFVDNSSSYEAEFKNKCNKMLSSNNISKVLNENIEKTFVFENDIDVKNKILQMFDKKDFINLRLIHQTECFTIYLVFHIKSQYIFALKTFNILSDKSKREVSFCQNHSHRCIMKCYGFLEVNGEIKGILYHYMCNGSLSTYMLQNSKKVTQIFSFKIMMRIFQGIKYFHSNFYIHRDLKPSNILLDNDYNAFISDLETIKNLKISEEENIKMTYDIGTVIYESPEQFKGDTISYPTDIYSFGLIIYFLFEHKNAIEDTIQHLNFIKTQNENFPKINKCSLRVKSIYEACIKFDPNERIDISNINDIIFIEINTMTDLRMFFTSKELLKELPQYLYENIVLLDQNVEKYLVVDYFYKSFSFLLTNIYLNGMNEITKYFEIHSPLINSEAMLILGYLYENGYGFKKNYTKAKFYYEKSAELNNSDALLYLGNLYRYGKGVKQDFVKAKEYFQKSHDLNNPEASYSLGYLFYNGYGVKDDQKKALYYFKIAAEQNNTHGINMLGLLYENGIEVDRNHIKALNYYNLSNKLKNGNALINLAHFYRNGYCTSIDLDKSKHYFELAARKGYPNGYLNLGRIYEEGRKVDIDYNKAREYYELAANLKHMDALDKLGDFYFYAKGVQKDITKAINYYQLAADLKNKDSLYKLGNIYENGCGVEINHSRSKKYFKMASHAKNFSASYKLAKIYINGEYFPVNVRKAIYYFKICSEINHENTYTENNGYYNRTKNYYCYPAYNELGVIYLTLLNDVNEAYVFLKQSRINGYPIGQNNYGLLCEHVLSKINCDEKYVNEAKSVYIQAAEEQFTLAEYNLGYFYEKRGDIKKAIGYYIQSSEHENNKLIFHYNEIDDKRLKISISFIILFVDLKLMKYFISQENQIKAKHYFDKIVEKCKLIIEKDIYKLQFEKDENIFIYIKDLFCNLFVSFTNNNVISSEVNNKREHKIHNETSKISLHDFIEGRINLHPIENKLSIKMFCQKLQDIINLMEIILYNYPYFILLGQFPIDKTNIKSNLLLKKANNLFYEGFGIKF